MKARPRILFVGNFLVRHWGRGRTGIDMRLQAGATRMDWPSLTFSDRDVTRFLAPMGFLRGVGAAMMNSRLVKTAKNWRPDVVFISHCDYVTNGALARIREAVGLNALAVSAATPFTGSALISVLYFSYF